MVRERTEDYVQWEKRHRGLCRNEYFVGVPAQRTISEVYNETTLRLEPEKIKVCGLTGHIVSEWGMHLPVPDHSITPCIQSKVVAMHHVPAVCVRRCSTRS